MVKCPRCGKEVSNASKEWDYAAFNVKLFNCPKLQQNVQSILSPRQIKSHDSKGKMSEQSTKIKKGTLKSPAYNFLLD